MQWSLNGVSELGWIHLIRGVPGRQLGFLGHLIGRRCPVDGRDKSHPTLVVPLTAWPCGLRVGLGGGDFSHREIGKKISEPCCRCGVW